MLQKKELDRLLPFFSFLAAKQLICFHGFLVVHFYPYSQPLARLTLAATATAPNLTEG